MKKRGMLPSSKDLRNLPLCWGDQTTTFWS